MVFKKSAGEIIDIFFVILIFVSAALIALSVACIYPFQVVNDMAGSDDDHNVEEAVESIIQHNTGIDIDLTPRSKETNNG